MRMPFPVWPWLYPGAKPFEPFRERLESKIRRREHRTPDPSALPRARSGERTAVRSAPGRDRAEARVIRASDENARRRAAKLVFAGPLQEVRELDRELHRFAHLARALGVGFAAPHAVEAPEQELEAVRDELIAERGIAPRARQIGVGDQAG